jgi:queuine tRNA-ribosyltransferase
MIDVTVDRLPEHIPRYLMGVGFPEDLIDGVTRGVDLFDCVIPTRNARNGTVFTRFGRMVIKGARYAEDVSPIDPECGCEACRGYTRSYIRHLFSAGEMLAMRLATTHNLFFFLSLMHDMRQAIIDRRFTGWKETFLQTYQRSAHVLDS